MEGEVAAGGEGSVLALKKAAPSASAGRKRLRNMSVALRSSPDRKCPLLDATIEKAGQGVDTSPI